MQSFYAADPSFRLRISASTLIERHAARVECLLAMLLGARTEERRRRRGSDNGWARQLRVLVNPG